MKIVAGATYKVKKDSSMSRQGMPDYIVTMRKAGKTQKELPIHKIHSRSMFGRITPAQFDGHPTIGH